MSKVKLNMPDGNIPTSKPKAVISDDELQQIQQSWNTIVFMRIGGYSIEFDAETNELSITGGVLCDVDCINKDLKVADIPECRTIVLKPSE